MEHQLSLFPVHDPLLYFTILTAIILFSPYLFRLVKIPDVASFIIMGVLVGPHGLNLLARDASIELLGTMGLLYIMFMAGLELDAEKFKLTRKNSIIFGISTFVFPFILGFVISKYVLNLGNHSTLLVSIMFATHTLVAYPIVRKLGVHRDISVLTAVGGTIFTDTLVLFILSVATKNFQSSSMSVEVLKLMLFFLAYIAFIFYAFPKITRWFFKYVKRDRPVHFLFVLFMVCVSSVLATLIGVEAIIGAFIAGLALNRSIPKNSQLLHHIDFVGNILFIPVFLIGIGMIINTRVLISGYYLWYTSAVLIAGAISGKWIAAFVTQKIIGFDAIRRNLLFGLSGSHAAATIAIILIGFEKGIINANIFNATVLIILFSCIFSTLISEKYAKKLAKTVVFNNDALVIERIMVPVSNPLSMANLVAVANAFNAIKSIDPVYILHIMNEQYGSKQNILKSRQLLEDNIADFNNLSENFTIVTRIDVNISSAILRAAKDHMISDIILGWGNKTTTSQKIFGNVFDHLLQGIQTLYVLNLRDSISSIRKIIVHMPVHIHMEPSFLPVIRKIIKLVKPDDKLEFRSDHQDDFKILENVVPKRQKFLVVFNTFGNHSAVLDKNTLNVMFLPRKESITYEAGHNKNIQKQIQSELEFNFMLIVPGFDHHE